jgi:preprotein translocase subunit YajC
MPSALIFAQESTNGTTSGWATLIVYVVILGAIFYFLILRPQRVRRERHRTLMDSLQVGDEVRTAGGVYGYIRVLDEDSAVIEVEDGTRIRFARGAIATKIEATSEE